jgi:hypothetical protein
VLRRRIIVVDDWTELWPVRYTPLVLLQVSTSFVLVLARYGRCTLTPVAARH